MEKGGNSAPSHCDVVSARGHNGHDANPAWDIGVDPNTACRFDDWNGGAAYAAATRLDATVAHARSFCSHAQPQHLSVCAAGEGNAHLRVDPHLTCLQLGKRRYFEDAAAPATDRYVGGEGSSGGCRYSYGHGHSHRRGRSNLGGGATAVPRCQVEGCHVALGNAKDYHKRHRVCDVHSKAPRVVVLGLEQRFCQQCSRFHAVSEFDDSKRSCRRRLAGHNERRRRSSHHDSAPKNSSHQGRALSLLSSTIDAWVSPSDLSSRSSAALRELIAEHRASVLATQLIVDRDWQPRHHAAADFSEAPNGPTSSFWPHQQQVLLPQPHSWVDAFQDDSGSAAQVTLELMQAPSSAFRFLSVRGKAKEDDCSETWKSFEGRHV